VRPTPSNISEEERSQLKDDGSLKPRMTPVYQSTRRNILEDLNETKLTHLFYVCTHFTSLSIKAANLV